MILNASPETGSPGRAGALRGLLALAFLLASAPACRRPAALPPEADVAVTVRLAPERTPAGWPVLVRYCFETGPDYRPLGSSWRAFVHFVASDGTTLVNDDHVPQPPPADWRPAQRYEYSRVIFTHRQFPGPLELRLGLFEPGTGRRVRLRAEHLGRGEHRLGILTAVAGAASSAVFAGGFHGPEGDLARPFVTWRATAERGTLLFRNPRAPAVLLLGAWAFAPPTAAPRLVLLAAGREVSRPLESRQARLVAVRLSPEQLGDDEWSPVDLAAEPALVAPAPDGRTLGVAIENAVLVPAARLHPALLALASE